MDQTFDTKKTIGDLVSKHPRTRGVFDRFGIEYYCRGTRDLKTAAAEDGVELDALLDALNDAIQTLSKGGATQRDWSEASASELADHIEQRIHAVVKKALPRIQSLMAEAIHTGGRCHEETLPALNQVLESLAGEIVMQIIRKEQMLFPLIRQLEAYARGHDDKPAVERCTSVRDPIREIEREHKNIVAAVVKMRTLTTDYSLSGKAGGAFAALNEALRALDEDLREQIELENSILFPRAIELEQVATAM